MSSLSYSVGLDASKFSSALATMRSGVSGLTGMFGTLTKALPIGGLIGGIGGLTGVFMGLKKASNLAADFESTSIAFKTLIGDADTAKRVIADIATLGEQTPFEFPELAGAGRMLISFNEGADTVVNTLRRIGDVSAGIQAPITEIAELYGKARIQGTLFAEDINQMTGRGIPIITELAKVIGVSESEIKGLASEGKITFPLLEQAFMNMTSEGGKFFNMMAEQSGSTKGLISTLTDGWNKLLRLIGEPLNDWLKPQITGWIENLDKAGVRFSALIKMFKAAQGAGNLGELIGAGLTLFAVRAINLFAGGIRGAAAFLGEAIPGAFAIGIGILQSSGLDTFFLKLFEAGGQALKAQIYKAISAIPGLGDYSQIGDTAMEGAKSAFAIAGFDLQDSIKAMPGAIKVAADEMQTLLKDSMKNAMDASSDPLIDPKNAEAGWERVAKAIDAVSWDEWVSGETKRQDTIKDTKKEADNLDKALAKLGDSAEKTKKKTTATADALGRDEEAKRPLRKIFMKKLRDGDPNVGQFEAGADGLFKAVPKTSINRAREAVDNAGRNAFGKNRAPRDNAEKRDETIDPLLRAVQKLDSIDQRLAALGLA